jgi:hypothetical protein
MNKTGNEQLQAKAAAIAEKNLAASDLAHQAKHTAPEVKVPVEEQKAPEPVVEPANVPVQEAARPNMKPFGKQRAASVGAGSTRSVPHATPFVPNAVKAPPASSVGLGQARRQSPAPQPEVVLESAAENEHAEKAPSEAPVTHHEAVASAPPRGAAPGVVTAESIAAAIAASKPKVAPGPAPRFMSSGRNSRG